MRHGTYDRNGNFHAQKVHFGRTASGKPGLFTGFTMAWLLTEEQASLPVADLKRLAESLGFEWDGIGTL